jgi:hypothetical protein
LLLNWLWLADGSLPGRRALSGGPLRLQQQDRYIRTAPIGWDFC